MTASLAHPRRVWQSTGAVLMGIVAVFVLSLGTDQLLHVLDVYPSWGQPMYDNGLCLLALSYRIVYTVIGSYLVARFAPHSPMWHAMVYGVIGLALGTAAAITTIPMKLSPDWYPIAIALTALPCAWVGAVLYRRWHAER